MKIKDFIDEYETLRNRMSYLEDEIKELQRVSLERYDLIDIKVQASSKRTDDKVINRIDKMKQFEVEIFSIQIDLIKYEVILDVLSDTELRVFKMIRSGYRYKDIKESLCISMSKLKDIIDSIEEKMDYVSDSPRRSKIEG